MEKIMYECAATPRAYRWTEVKGVVVEAAQYLSSVPEGPAVLTPEPGLRIEGRYFRGRRVGLWLEYRHGVLTRIEEWKDGKLVGTTPESPAQDVAGATSDDQGGPDGGAEQGPEVEELFAGMTAREWRVRLAEMKAAYEVDGELEPLWRLTRERARLVGLPVDDEGRMEEPR